MTTGTALTPLRKHVHFKLGDTLIYFHRWKRYEAPEGQVWFDSLSNEAVAGLAPGDEVWVDVDPLHRNGKVYGRVLVAIQTIEGDAVTGLRISFTSPTYGGYVHPEFDSRGKFAILIDEAQVWEWTKDQDAARNIY